jgi:glycerol-3-phosphate O-acyltransferase / dihydroxyacetone phosphate acyltransferase
MWLHRVMPAISALGVRAYYRVTISGGRLPDEGPVLVVANHHNSLVDPALVVVAAGRTVRFLAKAPLFQDKVIGWLVAAVGSVPVYRQQDDPTKLAQNADSFRDVHAALAEGHAVGIFPEGITHSASHLAPLKTGAARIALGAAQRMGRAFPIVAMGLVFRDRDAFRSEAHAIIGEPFDWDDLAQAGQTRAAVRELTQRIERAMRAVTLNLEKWEDEPIVRGAQEIWRAEAQPASAGASANPPPGASAKERRDSGGSRRPDRDGELDRLRATTEALAALRAGGDPGWREVAVELRAHLRQLDRLGITPAGLIAEVRPAEAVRWTVRQLPLVAVLPVALAGEAAFWIPRWVTTRIAATFTQAEGPESLVTHRVIGGFIIFVLWFLLVAVAVGFVAGPWWGVLAFVVLPLWGWWTLAITDRRRQAWAAVRRFFLRHTQREWLAAMRERQAWLAGRLRELYARVTGGASA